MQQAIPVLSLTALAIGSVSANRFITNIGVQCGADGNALGVCRQAAASGDKVTVDVLGTAIVEAGAVVAFGSTVKSDASGRAITWVTSGAKVGMALESASAAGQFIEVLLIPNVA